MNNGYQDPAQAENYSSFLNTEDGKFQKTVILDAVLKILNNLPPSSKILDLGCGPGWLCNELSSRGYSITGCDVSDAQINLAKKNYPALNFIAADPQEKLPFGNGEFNVVVASLVLNDVTDQPAALQEIRRVLKPGGKFINIITNPYYAFPIGIWKRGILGKLFGKKPKLQLRPYFGITNNKREFKWRENLPTRFHPLSEQLNNLIQAGFTIKAFNELKSDTDDTKFSRKYQLHRFPLYLLIECY